MHNKECEFCHGTGSWIEFVNHVPFVRSCSCWRGKAELVNYEDEYTKVLKVLHRIAKHKPSTTGNAIDAIADAYEDVKKIAREALK